MSSPDCDSSKGSGIGRLLADLLARALGKALKNVTALFAADLAADVEKRVRRVAEGAVWCLAMAAVTVAGALFIAVGMAQLLNVWIAPLGPILVGFGLLLLVLITYLARRGQQKA